MLQHYVFIKYAPGTAAGHIDEFCSRLLGLRSSIAEIKHVEIGRDILRDQRSWDLILIMRFESVEELRTYQQHSAHQQLMQFNQPFVAEIGAVDFLD